MLPMHVPHLGFPMKNTGMLIYDKHGGKACDLVGDTDSLVVSTFKDCCPTAVVSVIKSKA